MLLYILIAVAILIIGLVGFIATRPDDFRVTRSTVIAAPPAAVFPHVNDLHKWREWSPWAKMDPSATETHSGSPAGEGAKMAWAGKKSGAGSMTITQSKPNETVRFRLDFLKPFKATNNAEFLFMPEGNKTSVTWTMTGKNNFFFKAFSLIMNCDKMIGGDFEKGLGSMKSIVESEQRR